MDRIGVHVNRVAAIVFAVCCVAIASRAAAQADEGSDEERDLYARVIVDTSAVRTGPGGSYRRIYLAHRGDVFKVRERATRGYWFRVELPDGTTGWILGDTVYNLEVTDEEASRGRFLPGLFAPPPLPDASFEIAVGFGVLGSGGFMAVRPTLYIKPTFGIEVTAAGSVARGGRILMAGAGGIINLFPNSPIVPFVVVGGGFAESDPNADTFLLEDGSVKMLYGGGGLRFGFKYRLTVRVDVRAYAFYEADRYVAQEEVSGGLTVFF